MTLFEQLLPRAERTVAQTLRRLPPDVRELAHKLPVTYHDLPPEDVLGDEFEPDIMGMFIGDHHGVDQGFGNAVPPQIMLFLENIYDEAAGDLHVFDEEVRLTYLHELGHYLGWDEDDVEARGL